VVLLSAPRAYRAVQLTLESKANREKYLPVVTAAEKMNGLPAGLLDRLLYTESHYRTDIITGKTVSAVGAIGIAQFMPATAADWKIDPRDPVASIGAAARYLAWLYRQLGDWSQAVAAYNHGVGNVKKKVAKYGSAWAQYLPTETKNYVAAIVA